VGLTTRKPKNPYEEIWNTVRESLRDFATSDDKEDGVHKVNDEGDRGQGKLSEDNEPHWELGTIFKMVDEFMEGVVQKEMKLEELTQYRWGYVADYFRERDTKYRMARFQVATGLKPQTDEDAATSALTTVGELMGTVDIGLRESQMLQATFGPGCCPARLHSS
jgi:hypothetical protein